MSLITQPYIHKRRAVDLNVENNETNLSSLLANTRVGKRSTDNTLNKKDQSETFARECKNPTKMG